MGDPRVTEVLPDWEGSALDALATLLRPAGGGIFTVSTGKAAQRAIQRRIYGVAERPDDPQAEEAEIAARWRAALERLATARVALLGVPSDVGAGFVRGANLGPQALRQALLERAPQLFSDPRVVDAGDIFVVPQLLDDEMLSPAQLRRSRGAIYGPQREGAELPVSPLSSTLAVVRLLRLVNPNLAPLVLGGDHSVAWPVVAGLCAPGPVEDVGILHFDAHTDLLQERLGVRYCFATWAWHANELIGRHRRLVQVGLRISSKTRAHWEETLGVRQYWMDEVRARPPGGIVAEIVAGLRAAGVRRLYISNDIDGTDPAWAAATGTAEPGGLHPDLVCRLIAGVGAAFAPLGADLVEVAPPVASTPGEPARTLDTGARYLEQSLTWLLG